ncbi:elongation factor P--(R)-beta-lysine ligase [Salinimonas marina]|uniref:Elongation factor P--(R)-beta-lysine ligase n=2 Tax=Salinimonas marina TaxID=2785918 RepID=A0A7S9DX19_9ALTE|nr:elongation factor P--(R)-beta-lysine ligase [Salinimonas marina]
MTWQPTTSHAQRVARAELLRTIREFFYQREVLEVDTPLLSRGTVTDVHLDAFACEFRHDASGKRLPLYLQTSPEYAMKRLLCAGSGPVYQLCKAFRHEGAGRWHNPEFTMLEWYRPGFDHLQLMQEVDALLQATLDTAPAQMMSYQQVMKHHAGLDPLSASHGMLVAALPALGINIDDADALSNDGLLQLIFSMTVEPALGQQQPCFVYGFPASQAALARINDTDPRVADRFEVYFKGAELANGFYELADVEEQRRRFEHDNALRQQAGYPPAMLDENLLAALKAGLPDCAGVAMGIDRLLMLKTQASHIDQVISFPVDRA